MLCFHVLFFYLSLPPASEGWGKVIFSVCSHLRGWGGSGRWYPRPRSGGGGVPQPGLDGEGGVPWPGLDGGGCTPARSGWWGVPQPGLDGGGGDPGQIWMVGRGVPQPGLDGGGGTPSQVWMGGGVPCPGLDGGGGRGVPGSIASTCYAAAGMPLAFTQEDFLVL